MGICCARTQVCPASLCGTRVCKGGVGTQPPPCPPGPPILLLHLAPGPRRAAAAHTRVCTRQRGLHPAPRACNTSVCGHIDAHVWGGDACTRRHACPCLCAAEACVAALAVCLCVRVCVCVSVRVAVLPPGKSHFLKSDLVIFGFSAFTFLTGQFRGCRRWLPRADERADRRSLAPAGPLGRPAPKGAGPPAPPRSPARGPAARPLRPFQPLVSSRARGSAPRRARRAAPGRLGPAAVAGGPGCPVSRRQRPIVPRYCAGGVGGGKGRGLRCTMGDYPPGGGARRTPGSPPALGRREPGRRGPLLPRWGGGGAACGDPGVWAPKSPLPPCPPPPPRIVPVLCPLSSVSSSPLPCPAVPPPWLQPRFASVMTLCRRCLGFPTPVSLCLRCPRGPGVPVPPLSPCPPPSAVPVMVTPW